MPGRSNGHAPLRTRPVATDAANPRPLTVKTRNPDPKDPMHDGAIAGDMAVFPHELGS
jgi:hypothetical protein